MRGAFLCLWLLIPAAVAAYHYGPGQEKLRLDDAATMLRQAETQASQEKWGDVVESYDGALALLPSTDVSSARRIRLERAKAQMLSAQLPEAYNELSSLSEELAADKQAPAPLVAETRSAMATAEYYVTWLMRLEGRPREDWEPPIESSRQNYRLLAEQAAAQGDTAASEKHREDLEAAIRLARMDLSELQALPLPSQCQGCNSGKCKGCKKIGNKPKTGENDARGASSGPPQDNRGS